MKVAEYENIKWIYPP